jgi:predicted nucleic acid-binding protein
VKRFKIYLDTSVINFLFADDAPEKKEITKQFFDTLISLGIYEAFISSFVIDEIINTTSESKRNELLRVVSDYPIEILETEKFKQSIDELSENYISNSVVPASKKLDALHVAVCVLFEIDFLVSWNYKHLANVNREKKFLIVNKTLNYNYPLRIVTPENLFNDEY